MKNNDEKFIGTVCNPPPKPYKRELICHKCKFDGSCFYSNKTRTICKEYNQI